MRWVIGVIAALALGLGGNAQMDHRMGSASMTALEHASGKTFDIYWMSQMIEHHKGAVEMANSVLKDGKDARVKKAAQTIISDQSREIKQLTGWLKSWYNAVPNAKQIALMRADMKPMLEGAMGGMDGMSANADKRFLEGMIPHHQSAVEMGWLAVKKAARSDLKTFARKVIDAQSKEIKQYRTWLKGWK
jgi:uncharacterized protein (DUF305 family)